MMGGGGRLQNRRLSCLRGRVSCKEIDNQVHSLLPFEDRFSSVCSEIFDLFRAVCWHLSDLVLAVRSEGSLKWRHQKRFRSAKQ